VAEAMAVAEAEATGKTRHLTPSFVFTMRRALFLCIAATIITSALIGCGGGSPATLTQENLDKIQPDMSSKDVKAILGEPTDSKTEPIPIVGGTKTTYVYANKDDRVVIVLKNDNVQTKEGHFSSSH